MNKANEEQIYLLICYYLFALKLLHKGNILLMSLHEVKLRSFKGWVLWMYVTDAVVVCFLTCIFQKIKKPNTRNRSSVHLLFTTVYELWGHRAVKISQHEQRRGSTVCFRAQEGSVKSLWQPSSWLTCLPPETTAIKTCCRLPISSDCFLP